MSWQGKQSETAINVTNTVDADAQYTNFTTGWIGPLNAGEMVHMQIKNDPPGSPVDDVMYRVVTTLDETPSVIDNIGFGPAGMLDKDLDPTILSVVVSGCYKFRAEFRKNGTTTETHVVNVYYRRDGVDL